MKAWSLTRKIVTVAVLVAALAGGFFWFKPKPGIDLERGLAGRWAGPAAGEHALQNGSINLTGAVAQVVGRRGKALSFNGTSGRAWVPDSPDLAVRAGRDFSVMAWIQPIHADTSFGVMSIVEKRKVGGIVTARGFSLHLEYGCLSCQLSPAQGMHLTMGDLLAPKRLISLWKNRKALAGVNRFVSLGPNLCDGKFHHVALTVERDSTKGGMLYVDGHAVLEFDPTKLGGSMANQEPLLIGTHPDTTLKCGFKGLIEDVRLYSRAVSPQEIETVAVESAK